MSGMNIKTRSSPRKAASGILCICASGETFSMVTESKFLRRAALVTMAAGLMLSCSTPKPPAAPAAAPTWPLPPDEPRLVFVQDISRPADIGRGPSVWRRMARFITGGEGAHDGLLKPFGVGVDEAGNLCITDTGNRA